MNTCKHKKFGRIEKFYKKPNKQKFHLLEKNEQSHSLKKP